VKAEKKFQAYKGADFKLFITDHALHIFIIVITWLAIINCWTRATKMVEYFTSSYTIWLRVLGYIIVTTPIGFIIQFLTRKWSSELAISDSLPNAGKWIGILERLLILTMVYINQFGAIGFLVAAKSILRVTDKPDIPADAATPQPFSTRKHTEYVLIGTFLSVAIAIFTGLIINVLVQAGK
jgi:hypothetical protein